MWVRMLAALVPETRLSSPSSDPEVFELGVPARDSLDQNTGRFHLICWGEVAAGPLNVDTGALTMQGPHFQSLTCTLGIPCDMKISGVGLQAYNQMRFVVTVPTGNATTHGEQFTCGGDYAAAGGRPRGMGLDTLETTVNVVGAVTGTAVLPYGDYEFGSTLQGAGGPLSRKHHGAERNGL